MTWTSFTSPSGKSPYLMFTNRHEIRRIDLLKSEYAQVVPTLKNAVALDVDVSINKMFWCDLYHRKIYRYSQTQCTEHGLTLGVWIILSKLLVLQPFCHSVSPLSIHLVLFQPVTPSGSTTDTPGGCECVSVCLHLEGFVICLVVKGGAVCPSHKYSMCSHTYCRYIITWILRVCACVCACVRVSPWWLAGSGRGLLSSQLSHML